jgi:hypothetical protein
MSYALGEQRMNHALFNKVENISLQQVGYNQDRRALTDRWQNPGDRTQFKDIGLSSSTAIPRITSRFIQTENYLALSTISVTWRVPKGDWMKNLRMERLDIRGEAGGTSGVFRLTNVQVERGTSFPEAYRYAITIDATF